MPAQCGCAPRAAPARRRPTGAYFSGRVPATVSGLSGPFSTTGATRETPNCRARLLRLVDPGRGPRRRASGRPALDRHHVEPGPDVASGLSLAATRAARLTAVRSAGDRASSPVGQGIPRTSVPARGLRPYLPATVSCCPNASDWSAIEPRVRALARPQGHLQDRGRAGPALGARHARGGLGQSSPAPDQCGPKRT